MMKRIIYITLLGVLFHSCKSNELPEPKVMDEVVFYAEGTINGGDFFLEAGPNNIVVESSSELIEGELPIFSSSFENVDCMECGEVLTISLVGESVFNPETDSEFFIPNGNYNVSSFETQNLELGLFEVSVDEVDVLSFEIMHQDGFSVFQGEGEHYFNPGDYVFNMFSVGSGNDCFVEFHGGFNISEDGDVCLSQVYLDEDEQGVYLDLSDFDDDAIITVNDFSVSLFQNPSGLIYLDVILENDEFLESITVISLGQEGICGSEVLNYTFESADFTADCFPVIELEQVLEPSSLEPLSVFIVYQNTEGDYFSSFGNQVADSFALTELESFGEDLFGREAFRARVSFSVTLLSDQDIAEVVFLDITEAYIPLVFE